MSSVLLEHERAVSRFQTRLWRQVKRRPDISLVFLERCYDHPEQVLRYRDGGGEILHAAAYGTCRPVGAGRLRDLRARLEAVAGVRSSRVSQGQLTRRECSMSSWW